jgi:hypothetical protein
MMKTVWESVVFQLMVDTVILAEMREALSDIYTIGEPEVPGA